MAQPDPSETVDSLARAVQDAAVTMANLIGRAGEDLHGISGSQLIALEAIGRLAPINMSQLADELGTIPSWASRLCDRLEADGYIERRQSEAGRRQVRVTLRDPGRRLLSELGDRRVKALSGALELMRPGERLALVRGLTAFAAATAPVEQAGDPSARSA